MKRLVPLVLILIVAGGGLYLAQRRKAEDAVSANAVVDLAADWQRDISRAPMRVTRLPDADEIRIGNELVRRYGYAEPYENPEMASVENYVSQVGSRVARNAKRKIVFRFYFVPDPSLINAFALPGGHVFVGWGLLRQMHSEDELAFVLGHEIEHVDHYHAAERVQLEAQLHKLNLDVFAEAASIPLSLWQAGYSKDEEFEADREGLLLSAAAGYSAQGAVDLMKTFIRLDNEYVSRSQTPADALTQLAIESLSGYFRSHPLPSERLQRVRTVIAQEGLRADKPTTPLPSAIGVAPPSASSWPGAALAVGACRRPAIG
jgi:predicted Zn-dependent protease